MNVIKKILNRLYQYLYYILKAHEKKAFEHAKRDYYKYGDEIFYEKNDAKEKIIKRYGKERDEYWKESSDYSLSHFFLARYVKQYELIFEKYLPRISRDAQIADIGCASGEWTVKVLPYVKSIDGFEYSEKMVDAANQRAIYNELHGISFNCADARKIIFDKIYDGVMILGMLMYIDKLDDIYSILRNCYTNMKSDSLLVTKDTLNNENRDVVLIYNIKSGYECVYWSKELYYEQFKKAGFVLEEELLMDEVTTRHMDFIAIGAVWRRP